MNSCESHRFVIHDDSNLPYVSTDAHSLIESHGFCGMIRYEFTCSEGAMHRALQLLSNAGVSS
eukprot:COSAG05_NODE_1585_length_4485_cov_2.704514_2_plen_63_part_00